MFFSNWFGRRKEQPRRYLRPTILELEDRLTPSSWFRAPITPGPATHFAVLAPASVQVGQQFSVEVEALDANNHVATGYTGEAALKLGSADANAVFPADLTFTSSNRGVEWFTLTLTVAQSQKIIATDTTTSTITGSHSLTVKAAPAVTRFLVEAPHYDLADGEVTVTVVALSQYGRVDTGYGGTISFSSSVAGDTLPTNYTFNPATDHGSHTFDITFGATTGAQTISVGDTSASPPMIIGSVSVDVEAANAVTHFGVYAFGAALPGVPVDFVVTALDASNHVVAGYVGTVSFTSSDMSATLPASYAFQAADDGVHVFSATFETAGMQTLIATDANALTGQTTVWVRAHRFFWGDFWW